MKSSSFTRFAIRLIVATLLVVLLASPAGAQVTFFSPPAYSGSGNLFVADFNRDGKPDLLSSDGTLQLGQGNGTFTNGTKVSGTPLAVADFNGDGKQDVLEQGTGTLLVLLGNGDGTFQSPISSDTGAGMLAPVATADLRGDGKVDVLGLNNNNLVVFLGKGDGTFAAGVSYPVGNYNGFQIILGDFNGDQKFDVAVAFAGAPGTVVVLLGNGDGTFQSGKTSTGAYTPASAVPGDFNGDGKLDLAIYDAGVCRGYGLCTVPPSVLVLLGNGDGTFQAPTTAFLGGGTLATADLNGDGKLDLVVAPSPFQIYGGTSFIQIYLGNGSGTFSNPYNYEPNFVLDILDRADLVLADFNQDGKLDIAAQNMILLGNGNGSFQGLLAVAVPATAAVGGDFDKNGTQDVATVSDNNVYILLNDGTGVLTLAQTYTLQQSAANIATADLNGDGNLDLIVTGVGLNSQDWGYSVLLGKGDGSFQSPVFYQQNVQPGDNSIVVADFNNDHKPDFAVNAGLQTVAVLLGKGDGTFSTPAYFFNGGSSGLAAADFNGDGNIDLASAGAGLSILLGNGDGTFQPAAFPQPNFYSPFCAGDLTGDGKTDLVGSGIQVQLGNGDGTFKALSPFGSRNAPKVDMVADINGDGIPDLVAENDGIGTGGHAATYGVYLGNGDGTFGPFVTAYSFDQIGPLGTFVLAADMNADGKPDLVMGSFGGSVFVVPNTTQPGFVIAPASGQSASATVNAGQSAMFKLAVTASESFSGTVNLSCAISPSVTPAPTCSFLSNSVNVTPGKPAPVQVTVGTTAAVTTGTLSDASFPPGAMPLAWSVMLLASGLMLLRNRRRLQALGAAIAMLSMILFVGCGGGGSGSSHTTPGTPSGTYTVTVNGTSGSLQSSTALTVVVP